MEGRAHQVGSCTATILDREQYGSYMTTIQVMDDMQQCRVTISNKGQSAFVRLKNVGM